MLKDSIQKRPVKSVVPDKNLNKDAILLIQTISTELAARTKHYNKAGTLLTSLGDILECLLDEGSVTLEYPENKQSTSATA